MLILSEGRFRRKLSHRSGASHKATVGRVADRVNHGEVYLGELGQHTSRWWRFAVWTAWYWRRRSDRLQSRRSCNATFTYLFIYLSIYVFTAP